LVCFFIIVRGIEPLAQWLSVADKCRRESRASYGEASTKGCGFDPAYFHKKTHCCESFLLLRSFLSISNIK